MWDTPSLTLSLTSFLRKGACESAPSLSLSCFTYFSFIFCLCSHFRLCFSLLPSFSFKKREYAFLVFVLFQKEGEYAFLVLSLPCPCSLAPSLPNQVNISSFSLNLFSSFLQLLTPSFPRLQPELAFLHSFPAPSPFAHFLPSSSPLVHHHRTGLGCLRLPASTPSRSAWRRYTCRPCMRTCAKCLPHRLLS